MRTLLSGGMLMLACLSLSGCGESAEARMRRNALKNAPDGVSDDDAPPAALAKAQQSGSAPPALTPATEAPPASPGPGPGVTAPAPPQATAIASPSTSAETAPDAGPAATPPPPTVAAKTALPVAKPATPLSPVEQRGRSIQNLREIGKALLAHTQRTGKLPTVGTLDAAETHLLSWRVAILPELGYADLYRQFRHNEPWDSAHNKQLLSLIPAEYVSPERFDENTNYLGLSAPGHAFHWWVPNPLASFKDGLVNTVLIVEVDDAAAVPWTKPADFGPNLEEPRLGISTLRPEGAFALTGDGRVVSLGTQLTNPELVALFSIAGRDSPGLAATLTEPVAEMPNAATPMPAAGVAAATSAPASGSPPPGADSSATAATSGVVSAAVRLPGEPLPPRNPSGLPVPSAEEQAAARELFREVYGDRYEKAKQLEERQKLAQYLLAETPKVDANPIHFYELLRISRDVAVAGGDAATALKAVDLMVSEFNIEGSEQRLKVLEDLGKAPLQPQSVSPLCERSRALLVETFDADQFDLALRAYDVLVQFHRLQGDRAELTRLQKQRQPLEAAKAAYRDAATAAAAVKANPGDSAASETVGKYLCFVKNQWAGGLPYLARSAEIKFRVLATIDLETTRSPQEAYSLAEQYWELAEQQKQPFTRGLELRAAYYYQVALDKMLGGLEKVKAQRRIDEARETYGAEEVERVLGTLPSATAAE